MAISSAKSTVFLLLLLMHVTLIKLSSSSRDSHTIANNHGFELKEATIEATQRAFERGEITSEELIKLYKDQITRLNPVLGGVTELNPDAESEATRADKERVEGKKGTMLRGIPILVKDNIATKDKMNNTAGSYALLGSVSPRDAFVVKRLREAGAVILGKASLKEWSGLRSWNMPGGWSARSGQAKNPYNLSLDVCGSSSGSAISAAANFAAATLGTETDGSIICPSSYNSVVGIKPTVNLTSRDGVIPISLRQDSVGPIARTVADAVHVLDVIVGRDDRDPGTIEAATHIPSGGYAQYLKSSGLHGKRLGIWRSQESFNFPPDSVENTTFQQLFQLMRDKGSTLIDDLVIDNEEIHQSEMIVLLAELKRDLNSYLEELESSPMRSVADLITFNKEYKDLEKIDEFPQDLLIQANLTNGINKTVQAALANMERLSKNRFQRLMKEKQLDALIYTGQRYVPFLGVGGYPAITVPAGYNSDNMPFGICFGGLKYTEPTLIEIAYAFEQATKKRRPPPDMITFIREVTEEYKYSSWALESNDI